MHTNPKSSSTAEGISAASVTFPPQSKAARPITFKLCPGCGVRRAASAFPKLKPGEPFRAKIRCRSCERHGGAKLRRERARQRRLAENPGHKYCTRCGDLKPLEQFLRDERSFDGRAGACRDCRRAQGQARRASERHQEHARQRAASREAARLRREERFTIGLIAAYATCPPHHRRTCAEIAAYCDCTEEVIRHIEETALKKVLGPLTGLLHEADMHVREVRL